MENKDAAENGGNNRQKRSLQGLSFFQKNSPLLKISKPFLKRLQRKAEVNYLPN